MTWQIVSFFPNYLGADCMSWTCLIYIWFTPTEGQHIPYHTLWSKYDVHCRFTLFFPSQTCEDDNQHTGVVVTNFFTLEISETHFKKINTFLQTNHNQKCQCLPSCSVLGIPDASHNFVWSATDPVHCRDLVMNSYGLKCQVQKAKKLKVQLQ